MVKKKNESNLFIIWIAWLFIAFDNKNDSDDNYHYFFLNYEKSSV